MTKNLSLAGFKAVYWWRG